MSDRSQRLTRRQQRLAEKQNHKEKQSNVVNISSFNLQLIKVKPLTDNQQITFEKYDDGDHLLLCGAPGTGKTFLSMYLAFEEIQSRQSKVNRLVIIRSAQPSKQIGFLKGTDKEKVAVYETPYRMHCAKLFGRADAYDILKQKGLIEFQPTSFLRGTEIDDAVILYDEFQNGNYMECRTVISRLGANSRLILAGDTKQDDLTSARFNEESGASTTIEVLRRVKSVSEVIFTVDDIVRNGFIKEFILAEMQLGLI